MRVVHFNAAGVVIGCSTLEAFGNGSTVEGRTLDGARRIAECSTGTNPHTFVMLEDGAAEPSAGDRSDGAGGWVADPAWSAANEGSRREVAAEFATRIDIMAKRVERLQAFEGDGLAHPEEVSEARAELVRLQEIASEIAASIAAASGRANQKQ